MILLSSARKEEGGGRARGKKGRQRGDAQMSDGVARCVADRRADQRKERKGRGADQNADRRRAAAPRGPDTSAAYKEILSPFNNEIPIFRFDFEDQKRLTDILNNLFVFSREHKYYGNPADEFYIHTKFQEFLYTLYELKDKNQYKNEQSYNSIEQKMYEVSSFIHAHYDEDISLDSLSEQFFISSSYLSREFKQVTGFNLSNYIQLTRIKNAQYRLVSSNDKISLIAQECGFSSFSQFNRVFNKITGTSPREYRQTAIIGK